MKETIFKQFLMAAMLVASSSTTQAGLIGYSVSGDGNLYSIDFDSGSTTLIGDLGFDGDFEALAFDPISSLLYTASDGDSLYTVDTVTGGASLVGSLGVEGYANGGMAFDGNGQGYLVTTSGLFSFDKSSGAASLIGDPSPGIDFSGGAFVGSLLYATPDNGDSDQLITLDLATGNQTNIGSLGVYLDDQTGLSYDAASDVLYMLNETDDSIYSLNRMTGAATLVTTFSGSFESLAILPSSPAAVSSPGSLPLMGLGGLLAFGFLRRRDGGVR